MKLGAALIRSFYAGSFFWIDIERGEGETGTGGKRDSQDSQKAGRG